MAADAVAEVLAVETAETAADKTDKRALQQAVSKALQQPPAQTDSKPQPDKGRTAVVDAAEIGADKAAAVEIAADRTDRPELRRAQMQPMTPPVTMATSLSPVSSETAAAV
jgi:hypothetical protein